MLSLYVFAAILGGGLLLFGMLSGSADAADTDAIEIESHLGAHDLGWKKLLSFRVAAYALAAFGLTGTALSLLGTNAVVTVASSLVMGGFGGVLATTVFGWLRRTESGFAEPSSSYIGGVGRLEVRIPAGGRGRLHLVHRGRAFTLPAMSGGEEIDRNEAVLVLDVVEGVALVRRAPGELISLEES